MGSGRHEAVASSFSNIHNGDLVTADGDQEGLGILLRADARAHQVCGISAAAEGEPAAAGEAAAEG